MPETLQGDHVDEICHREFGYVDNDVLRAVLWINPQLGASYELAGGVEYSVEGVLDLASESV